MADRFTGGFTRTQVSTITRAGGPLVWFDKQLNPAAVRESSVVAALPGWYPLLRDTPAQRFANERSNGPGSYQYAIALANDMIQRRVHTNRPVHELMVELWSDHLHVPSTSDGWYWRQGYDAVIRRHALGKFSTLLVAASLHPAMLAYLDNRSSTAKAPNENHGRELLELHTVGRGAYTEDEVKASARILSGWTVSTSGDDAWVARYDPTRHSTVPASVLGFRSNGDGRGGQTARDYLVHLARDPRTARMVCTKLARRFVSDSPSAVLVNALAKVYLAHDTDIRPVLRALVRRPEFRSSAGLKVRTPVEDLIATLRVLGVRPTRPTSGESAGNALIYSHGGLQPYFWPRPDGRPDVASAHAGATRVMNSFRMHLNLAGGYWPRKQVTYRSPGAFLPPGRPTVAQYADHLARTLHGRPASTTTKRAVAQAIGLATSSVIDPKVWPGSALTSWAGVRALAVMLDHPHHFRH